MNTNEKYCCEKFQNIIDNPESAYDRKTTFWKSDNDKWYTDFSDGEYGDIELDYCPFCGEKL